MRVVFFAPGVDPAPWIAELSQALPEAEIAPFDPDGAPSGAEYAVVWAPPDALFEKETNLRAVFNLGAGVDALLGCAKLPPDLPVVRLSDAGMSVQMAEYVCHAVIRHFRELDRYEADMRDGRWTLRRPPDRSQFPVGVMGLGAIGARVAEALTVFEFPVHGWSRSPRPLAGVVTHSGPEGFLAFLAAVRVLVCVLPLTPETEGILNHSNLSRLLAPAYVINVARGAHLVEDDLLALIHNGHVAGATLDVFREEPLPREHPFWREPRIVCTPHISARTLRERSLMQIAGKIRAFAAGEPIEGIVTRTRGY